MNHVYLAFGSNLGNRKNNLKKALLLLEKYAGFVGTRSAIYETEPWECNSVLNFYNQVVEMFTSLDPFALLNTIHDIEYECGRAPDHERYAPRTLDIDILFFNMDIINEAQLMVPHPGIPLRRFVLLPLSEIAPHFIHPVEKRSITELLQLCPDDKKVIKRL